MGNGCCKGVARPVLETEHKRQVTPVKDSKGRGTLVWVTNSKDCDTSVKKTNSKGQTASVKETDSKGQRKSVDKTNSKGRGTPVWETDRKERGTSVKDADNKGQGASVEAIKSKGRFVLKLKIGGVMPGKSCEYRIDNVLGYGCYGCVIKCTQIDTEGAVALKIVRNDIKDASKREIKILSLLRQLDPDKNNLVKFTEHFTHGELDCLVFEILDKSLYDFMESRGFIPLHVSEIRVIAQQMLVALNALKSIGVIHTDIKPDNVMLVNQESKPFKVKLIDFGVADERAELSTGMALQPIPYKSFEVLLGLQLHEAMDMWSLACSLTFLYLAMELYPRYCQYELMRVIVQMLGHPDNDLLNEGLYTKDFFSLVQQSPEYVWRLKTPNEYEETKKEEIMKCAGIFDNVKTLNDLPEIFPKPSDPKQCRDIQAFMSLLRLMFILDPTKRITPAEALSHHFITETPVGEQ